MPRVGCRAGLRRLSLATAALAPDFTQRARDALHPLRVAYVRNAVARVLTPGARDYRIIVLEHWRELRDFTEDARYFGSPEAVEEMYRDLPGFADPASTTTGPVSEYAFD